jgi:hypothetical protein
MNFAHSLVTAMLAPYEYIGQCLQWMWRLDILGCSATIYVLVNMLNIKIVVKIC